MADPLADAAQRYGPIGAGLLIGTLAKYGLTLSEGTRITWRGIVTDLLLQGVLGLIAIAVSDVLGLTGNARVFVGALSALNSARLVAWARDKFFTGVQERSNGLVPAAKAAPGMALVPAGLGMPERLSIQPEIADTPDARAGAMLKTAFRKTTPAPADQTELLRALDAPPVPPPAA